MLPRSVSAIAASFVLAFHFVFVVTAVFGGFGVLLDPRWAWVHVPIVLWSSLVNLAGWTCPLTPLEKCLRAGADQRGYEGGFVEHYLAPLVYPKGMPRRLELVAGVSVLVCNALVYALVFWLRGV